MEVYRRSPGLLLLLGLFLLATTLHDVQGEAESEGPSESECRPYIEKALKELETVDLAGGSSETGESQEDIPTVEVTDDSEHQDGEGDNDSNEGQENTKSVDEEVAEQLPEPEVRLSFFQRIPILSKFFQTAKKQEVTTDGNISGIKIEEQQKEQAGNDNKSDETSKDSKEDQNESAEMQAENEGNTGQGSEETEQKVSIAEGNDVITENKTDIDEDGGSDQIENEESEEKAIKLSEQLDSVEQLKSVEQQQGQSSPEIYVKSREAQTESQEDQTESEENQVESKEQEENHDKSDENLVESRKVQPDSNEEDESQDEEEKTQEFPKATEEQTDSVETTEDQIKQAEDSENQENSIEEVEDETYQSKEQSSEVLEKEQGSQETEDIKYDLSADITPESDEESKKGSVEEINYTADEKGGNIVTVADDTTDDQSKEETVVSGEIETDEKDDDNDKQQKDSKENGGDGDSDEDGKTEDKLEDKDEISGEIGLSVPVEELSVDVEMPSTLRSRDHVEQLLKLDDRSSDTENIINKVSEITLKELKKLYENAIKPLEVLFKYRDLSNRHFGDAEIFSKPLILFMGPWSGGKSSIINYLINNEFNETSLRTGAEPSPAYFNILMYGDEPEVIDGTELAADFTFSGLQKFGQGLEERLRGYKIPTKLLEKVNIVEIPGILEVRKQVSRVFPFNDACQWFIDRADIIFLVYDPSKLDVGPETEAILDQLKGREHQTRIVLNKADQIKPEELMRVQGALIWNISPLMSSPQPPIMYTASLWSRPYESWAPIRLLQAQERAFLRDLRSAIDKRIENKIASARRFAVRVRNHAKMVDCYLTTYYNHKSVFGNRKQVADEIIEHPQDYHIYEGLSTLTNISRYDLPDPDVYRDFFKLNPLYEFQQLSATCTYFRGCPINRLDVAIAYDLPELVGTYKKLVENALADSANASTTAPGS